MTVLDRGQRPVVADPATPAAAPTTGSATLASDAPLQTDVDAGFTSLHGDLVAIHTALTALNAALRSAGVVA